MNSDDLDDRIAQARARNERRDPATKVESTAAERSGMSVALRAGSQFVAAIVAGGILGWGLDRLLGTSPFGLLAMLPVGFLVGLIGLKKFMT